MDNFFKKFKLDHEKEDMQAIITSIDNGVVFRGTNLWVLIFAIFVASLGLNLNSTAVIIGAMLISPLMGPIMGIGLGVGINDWSLLRKAIYNFFVATIVALTTSTFFFLISPINAAHSEILARTSPTIYDVLIALFGGFAGITATASKQKGNVIPGVAIATALMPPLCTAGYGLATLQFHFFYGAFYLFIINTVFIALATFIMVRLLDFPYKNLQNKKSDKLAHRLIIWIIVLATLIPSVYFGYDMVQQDRFTKNANRFIANEAHFPNDYLLNKKIDAKAKKITLVFGGKEISSDEIDKLKKELEKYGLAAATLEIKQGFAYLSENIVAKNDDQNEQINQLTQILTVREEQNKQLQSQVDSMKAGYTLNNQLFAEIKVQFPAVKNAIIQPAAILTDSTTQNTMLILLSLSSHISYRDRIKLEKWLKIRLQEPNINLIFQ